MLLLHRVSFYAADVLSLVYFMETFKLDGIQHPGKPIAAAASSGVYIQPIQVSDCKEFNRGVIFFFFFIPSEVFPKRSAWGEWLSTGREVEIFAFGRMCAVESQSSQMEGIERRPPGKESRGEEATGM